MLLMNGKILDNTLRISEELAHRGIRDETTWSLYAGLDQHLGYLLYDCSLSLRRQFFCHPPDHLEKSYSISTS